jgi:uncharacterized membrane protein
MNNALRPWIGCAFGIWMLILGARMFRHPERFIGQGVIPLTVPRTVRFLGVVAILVGIANLAIHIPKIISE